MKYILIIVMALSMNFSLTACTGQVTSEVSIDSSKADTSSVEIIDEGDEMKHEILTIKAIEDSTLIAVNEKNERYIIIDYIQSETDFETGQKIGVSYKTKNENKDGDFELTEVKVTKEGPVTLAPIEK